MASIEKHKRKIERYSLVINLRQAQGKTFREIGKTIGVSPAYANQIYKSGVRSLDFKRNHWERSGLTTHASLSIWNANFKTKREVLSAVESGALAAGCMRGYGKTTHNEVLAWIGRPDLIKIKTPMTCPHCGKVVSFHALRASVNE